MKKGRVIQFRVEPRLGESIDLYAKTLQVSVSEFVRSTLRHALHVDTIELRAGAMEDQDDSR